MIESLLPILLGSGLLALLAERMTRSLSPQRPESAITRFETLWLGAGLTRTPDGFDGEVGGHRLAVRAEPAASGGWRCTLSLVRPSPIAGRELTVNGPSRHVQDGPMTGDAWYDANVRCEPDSALGWIVLHGVAPEQRGPIRRAADGRAVLITPSGVTLTLPEVWGTDLPGVPGLVDRLATLDAAFDVSASEAVDRLLHTVEGRGAAPVGVAAAWAAIAAALPALDDERRARVRTRARVASERREGQPGRMTAMWVLASVDTGDAPGEAPRLTRPARAAARGLATDHEGDLAAILASVSGGGPASTARLVRAALRSPVPRHVCQALEVGRWTPEDLRVVRLHAASKNDYIAEAALIALQAHPEAVPEAVAALDRAERVAVAACLVLGEQGSVSEVTALRGASEVWSRATRRAAEAAILAIQARALGAEAGQIALTGDVGQVGVAPERGGVEVVGGRLDRAAGIPTTDGGEDD